MKKSFRGVNLSLSDERFLSLPQQRSAGEAAAAAARLWEKILNFQEAGKDIPESLAAEFVDAEMRSARITRRGIDVVFRKKQKETVRRLAAASPRPRARRVVIPHTGGAHGQKKQRGAASRSSAKSGDGNSDSDPEPERHLPNYLYDQATLAGLLAISKKTLQNLYSKTPWELPAAILIPGARGPRWTHQAVQTWLSDRPQHTQKTPPQPAKKKVGRPRIALAQGKGGAA